MTTPIAEQFAAIAARLAEIKPPPAPAAPRQPGEHSEAEVEALRRAYLGGGVTACAG